MEATVFYLLVPQKYISLKQKSQQQNHIHCVTSNIILLILAILSIFSNVYWIIN